MKIAIRPLFLKRTALETWLMGMAEKGWILQNMDLIIFQGFASFQFQAGKPQRIRYVLYEKQQEDDEAIWRSLGWSPLCYRDGLYIFQHSDMQAEFPILHLKDRFYGRMLKSLLNLSFLLAFLWILRFQESSLIFPSLFFSSFFLLILPNDIGLIGTQKEMRITRILKNILISIVISFCLSFLLYYLIDAIQRF